MTWLVWPVPLAQVLSRPQLIFPSKTWFFEIYLNFQGQKSLKNQYLPNFESKSYQINSIKFLLIKMFPRTLKALPIPQKFPATIWFNFQWGNHSIFKNFCTASANAMKPSWCNPPPRELSKETKNAIWSIPIQWISQKYKTKQTTYLPRCLVKL
jgi:hypothetical protein